MRREPKTESNRPDGCTSFRLYMCAAASRPHGIIRPVQGASNNDLALPARRTKGDTFLEGAAMTEDQRNEQKNDARLGEIARRDFVALSVTAGLAATAGAAAAASRALSDGGPCCYGRVGRGSR